MEPGEPGTTAAGDERGGGRGPAPDAPSEDRALDRVVFAGVGLAILFFLANTVAYEYGRDQGIYAVVAEAMHRGGAPYRDAWDFKPPGIFFVYALARALFGPGQHAVRLLEALGFLSLVYAFGRLSRRYVGAFGPGVVAGLIAVGTEAQLEFWHTAQPESFGAVLIAWGLVAAGRERGEGPREGPRQLASLALAGALYTAAALLKPPLGGGFVVSLVATWVGAYRAGARRPSAFASPALAYAGGGALVLSLVAAYFAAKGALGDLSETLFVFTPHYTRLSFRSEWFWGFVYMAFEQWSVGFSAFIACGLGLYLALPPLGPREREGAVIAAAVAALQLIGVGLQAKFFPYHYGAALPLASLLAGWGFWKLWTRARGSLLGIAGTAALLYVLGDARGATRDLEDTYWTRCKLRMEALWDPVARAGINDRLYSVADVNAGANRRVAAWLAEHTAEGAPVFVWGFEPVIYDMARRTPASRYVYNVPQRVSWAEGTRSALMADLARTPPAAVVVEHRDVFPAVTGSSSDSADSLRGFPALADLLRERYWLVNTIEDFDLYLKRD